MSRLHTITFAAFFLFAAQFLNLKLNAQTTSDVPRIISFQGNLRTTEGTAMTGIHHITITLYSDRSGTASLWKGGYDADVKDGIFTIFLGSGASKLPDVPALNRPLWLGMKVDEDSELKPL